MQVTNKQRNLWIIIAITTLNAIGITLVFPLFPFLVGKYLPESQIVVGLSSLLSVYALCQFFAAPVFGALSDRFGRKSILIISLFGSAIGYFLLGVGGALWVLFLGRIVDGLTAGNISTLFAYIADSTEPGERTQWFGYLGGAIGVGFMIGPAIGGVLGTTSISLPFYVTAGITFVSILCVYFLLPESLAPEKRTKQFSIKSLNTFAQFKEIFTLKEVRALLIMGAFFSIGLSIYQFNLSIFLKDVFLWGPAFIGGILTVIGVCDIVSRMLLLPQMLKRFSERSVGMVGLGGLMLGLALVFVSAYLPSTILLLSAVIFITLGEGLFDPTYNGLLSRSVDESKQGSLQGANQSLQAAYHVIVPLAAAALYVYSHSILYGIATLILAWALVMFAKIAAPQPITH
ncbi:tetracycline resistance MFS efflux pump [soil metagenome]